MKYVMLDIETVPLEIEHEEIRNYLMDKKISKEMRSFDPNYSKIVMIGVKPLGGEARFFSGEDEKELLEDFWGFLKENPEVVLVTHNGYRFDVPFLILRSCVQGVEIPVVINTNKWQMEKSNHFDLMLFFSHYETFTNPNLEMMGKMHGFEVGERIKGEEVGRFYKEGNWEKIKGRCQGDVEVLEKLFGKLCWGYLEKSRFK